MRLNLSSFLTVRNIGDVGYEGQNLNFFLPISELLHLYHLLMI